MCFIINNYCLFIIMKELEFESVLDETHAIAIALCLKILIKVLYAHNKGC